MCMEQSEQKEQQQRLGQTGNRVEVGGKILWGL